MLLTGAGLHSAELADLRLSPNEHAMQEVSRRPTAFW